MTHQNPSIAAEINLTPFLQLYTFLTPFFNKYFQQYLPLLLYKNKDEKVFYYLIVILGKNKLAIVQSLRHHVKPVLLATAPVAPAAVLPA